MPRQVLPSCTNDSRAWERRPARSWSAWRRPREMRENLFHFLLQQGYQLCLLHPAQTHWFAKRRGLRAKTDQLDAQTIGHVWLSGQARLGYVPDELIAAYRELVRLHSQLSADLTRHKNEMQALLQVLFPEFIQVFADPCRPTAVAVLTRYPGARAIAAAGVETLTHLLQQLAPRTYGQQTAEQLVGLAVQSISSPSALDARQLALQILCEELSQIQRHLAKIEAELEHLRLRDPQSTLLRAVPEFGLQTVAVLRAELGDVTRFQRIEQAVAYAGLDIAIKESGKWQGQAKLSKRGSGLLRQMLYLAAVRSIRGKGSAFGAYYRRLVGRGMPKGAALVAVMRKMLVVAVHLLRTGETYDPTKVSALTVG
jgi:transposase